MKNIFRVIGFSTLALTLTTLNGCIRETEPTSIATTNQVAASSSATSALASAQAAYFNHPLDDDFETFGHRDFGYGAMIMIRNVLDGDFGCNMSGYNHFSAWERNLYLGDSYTYGQMIWNYYYGFVLATNTLIKNVDTNNATEEQLGYLGTGYAFRALVYLDLARVYEFLENDGTSSTNSNGNNVLNLTVPIINEKTTEEEARNNPRATRDSMFNFILSDLQNAEKYIGTLSSTNGKTLPDLACVYGLYARLYMWVEDYASAEKYADLAIKTTSSDLMTQTECLNTTTGFNVADPWMWASQLTSEDVTVQSGIINWASELSDETTFGYKGPSTGLYNIIDKNMYDRISDKDWRKLEWKAPAESGLRSGNAFVISAMNTDDEESSYYCPDYTSLKFRPGSGNADDYMTGGTVAFPIMRVEEMYFIKAEAQAQQGNSGDAISTMEEIMSSRMTDGTYSYNYIDKESLIDEIVFQKRVELWGEGQTFFDIKRLDKAVTRGYSGTNHYSTARLNTSRRPAWMNFCIVRTEANNNKALDGWNNPDPSGVYSLWTGE